MGSSKRCMSTPRRALSDLTNSDSPIASLAAPRIPLACAPSDDAIPSPPESGEILLRSQVNFLLEDVEPQETPAFKSTIPDMRATLENAFLVPSIIDDGSEFTPDELLKAEVSSSGICDKLPKAPQLGKIKIGEAVVPSRISFADRHITRSLNFGAAIKEMEQN